MFNSPHYGCEVLWSACLSVCLSVCSHVSNSHVQTEQHFLCMFSLAVARSASDDNAICNVLPFLWMTTYFHLMEPVAQNQNNVVLSSSPGGSTKSSRSLWLQACCWMVHVRSLYRDIVFLHQCTVVDVDHRGGWTQIFTGKASEPATSQLVVKRNVYLPHLHFVHSLGVIPSDTILAGYGWMDRHAMTANMMQV